MHFKRKWTGNRRQVHLLLAGFTHELCLDKDNGCSHLEIIGILHRSSNSLVLALESTNVINYNFTMNAHSIAQPISDFFFSERLSQLPDDNLKYNRTILNSVIFKNVKFSKLHKYNWIKCCYFYFFFFSYFFASCLFILWKCHGNIPS